ncbi:hypothetical protein PRIPAC_77922 [Pristionchus pacificus]|uniref:Uncharacterized protein n=1 Tax=Pristionchus pacificus TaxID=54126 RepID=A0A2A6BDV4_PRIPA|nr:hypothetical protein PRIPAC_77922 [Pristionchus pacificus]|eukprot:PDM64085.1 hypothetical protein PRIPAC_54329 [Pristionchus pacificus]
MDGGSEFIQPEFINKTVFRSILLFPDREDLVAFVGEYNAWYPLVRIVQCDNDVEIIRGAYGVSCIERDYDKGESSFKVMKSKLKFPEGFIFEKDKRDFEGLAKEIE